MTLRLNMSISILSLRQVIHLNMPISIFSLRQVIHLNMPITSFCGVCVVRMVHSAFRRAQALLAAGLVAVYDGSHKPRGAA